MSDEWDDSSVAMNYGNSSSKPNDYGESDPKPVYNQSYQNSSYQRRGRGAGVSGGGGGGGGGGRGRSNYRYDDNQRQQRAPSGRRQYNWGSEDSYGYDAGRQNNFEVGDSRQRNRGFNRNEDAVAIKVPSRFVGRIIGKGGSKINDLEMESGAKIKVTKEEADGETIIRLMGTPESTKKAEELIKDLTVDRTSSFDFASVDHSAPAADAPVHLTKSLQFH